MCIKPFTTAFPVVYMPMVSSLRKSRPYFSSPSHIEPTFKTKIDMLYVIIEPLTVNIHLDAPNVIQTDLLRNPAQVKLYAIFKITIEHYTHRTQMQKLLFIGINITHRSPPFQP